MHASFGSKVFEFMWNVLPQCGLVKTRCHNVGQAKSKLNMRRRKNSVVSHWNFFPLYVECRFQTFYTQPTQRESKKKRELSRVRVIATYLFSCRIINRFICTISVSQERKNGVQIGKPRRKRIKSRVKNTAHTHTHGVESYGCQNVHLSLCAGIMVECFSVLLLLIRSNWSALI